MRWSVAGARAVVSLVVLGVLGVACSSSKTGASGDVTARFVLADAAPPFLDVPFPSDAYLAGGKIVDPLPGLERLFTLNSQFLSHELGKTNGFSRIAMSLFYVDDAAAPRDDNGDVAPATLDPASLPTSEVDCGTDAASVFLLDMAATDPAKARVACRATFHDDRALAASRPLLAVGPARGVLLEEAHAYAAVVTSRVKARDGRKVSASADFHAVAAGDRTSGVRALYADAIAKAKAALGPALATDGAEIVAIAPYTTQKMTDQLYAMRDALEDAPPPALAWDAATVAPMGAARFAAKGAGALPAGFTATLDDWLGVVPTDKKLPDGTDDSDASLAVRAHDKFAAIGTAVFSAQNYLQVKPGGYDTLDHATIATDAAGKPILSPDAPSVKIWVTIAIPTAPMPPSGYPVVMVGHGLSSSRKYLLDMGNAFAAKGWAVVAIDGVTFGARAPEAKYQADKGSDYAGKNGATYAGPDGFADLENGPVDFFGNLKNMGAFRDQFRHQGFDVAQLVRLIRSAPDLAPLDTGAGAPKFDGDKIAYFGDSFGGITGATAAAIEPHVKAWFLNVAGGGVFTEIAAHGPGIAASLAAAATFNFRFGPERFDESHPLNVIGQTLAEAGDPIAFAKALVLSPRPLKGTPTSPRNILQTEVVYDELVANEGGEALARAAGMGLATPNVGSNAGIVDVKDMTHNTQRVPLRDVAPDAVGIHDTPIAGVTAVVVQASPGQHGYDAVRSTGKRNYAIPYGRTDGTEPFVRLDTPFDVRCPYRELLAAGTRFFEDAFAGRVPVVTGFKPPVRDADDDGAADDVDADPNDPKKK
jgi:dienelactone hydrolase